MEENHSNSNNNTNLPRKNLCDFLELKTLYPLRWTMRAAITKYCVIELASRLLCIGFVQMKRWANEGSVCRTQGLVDPIKDPFPFRFFTLSCFLALRPFGLWAKNIRLTAELPPSKVWNIFVRIWISCWSCLYSRSRSGRLSPPSKGLELLRGRLLLWGEPRVVGHIMICILISTELMLLASWPDDQSCVKSLFLYIYWCIEGGTLIPPPPHFVEVF